MKIEEGDQFTVTYSNQSYVVVINLCGNIVLAPTAKDDDQCLIYTVGEIEELVNNAQWVRKAGCKS